MNKNMRKLVFVGAALLLAAACNSGNQYSIKGTVTGDIESLVNGKAYLFNRDRNNPVKDTVDVVGGKFHFKGTVSTAEPYVITIEGVPGSVQIFLENDNYTVAGADTAFSQSVVTGGDAQKRMTDLGNRIQAVADEYGMDALMTRLRVMDLAQQERDSLLDVYIKYQDRCEELKEAAVNEAPVSNFALYFLNNDFFTLPLDSVGGLLEAYHALPEFESNRILARLDTLYQKELSLQPGNKCQDFTMNGPDGEPVTLSDIYSKNKVTMVDFWASWCSPCRQFNPKLVEIYRKYHKDGLEILGVSLDMDKNSWLAAIESDKLTWPHVSDLKYLNSAAVSLFNVNFIPQNIFVDSEGTIVAHRLSEDEIPGFLEEYLK